MKSPQKKSKKKKNATIWSNRLSGKGNKLGRKRKFKSEQEFVKNRRRIQREYLQRRKLKQRGECNNNDKASKNVLSVYTDTKERGEGEHGDAEDENENKKNCRMKKEAENLNAGGGGLKNVERMRRESIGK